MTKQDPQAAVSAVTYAKRYSLQAVAGIPSEDDDGNNASKSNQQQKRVPTTEDLKWASAIKQDATVLDQIQDSNYKKYIQSIL